LDSEEASYDTKAETRSSFLLGRSVADNSSVELPVNAFKRHFMALGGSGSGKTVLCKCIIEEAVQSNIPAIIIDPQGDIASLAVRGDSRELMEHGTLVEVQEEFFSKARIAIFTPASNKAIPLSVNPFRSPSQDVPPEEAVQAIDLTAASLTSFLGYDPNSDGGRGAKAYLFTILEHQWRQRQKITDVNQLADAVLNPPARIAPTLNSLVARREQEEIARKLRFLTVGTSALMFQLGVQIDIGLFVDRSDGKVPVNIVYLNTLTSENDKQFFVATLLKELYCWMLKNPSNELRLLFYVDEISPYIPPYPRNPPPKNAYALLFKQARKYGLGLVAATQNITDIDYKALAQVNTWCLGRMMTTQDVARVQRIIQSIDPAHAEKVLQRLPSLKTGEFLLLSPDCYGDVVDFHVRWLATKHLTLDEKDLAQCVSPESRMFFEKYIQKKVSKKWTTAANFSPSKNLEERTRRFLYSARKAVSADRVARGLKISSIDSEKVLRKLVSAGTAKRGRAKGRSEYMYWISEFNLDPSKDIIGEVLTIPVGVTQVEATKRAKPMLEGGALRKEEEILDAEFSHIPIWRIVATREVRSFLSKKEEKRTYYVSAQNAAIVSLEKKEIVFHKLLTNAGEKLKNLDEDKRIAFVPKLPSEVAKFPHVKLGADAARQALEVKIGVRTVSAELVLLPTWCLKVSHRKRKDRRTINMEAATGRLLSGHI
jgi:ABC-type dipeptide/oligopeptide/nickel transport system ATPase component